MKRWILVLFGMMMVLASITGCTQATADDALTAVKKAGKLKIAMEGNWAPWTYHDEADELVGYDVEVGKAIAAKLGVEAEFYEGAWDGLFAGVDAGRYDTVINGVDWTEERAKKYDFSDPYLKIYTVLITKSDEETIQSFEDLKGRTTANSLDSTYMQIAESYGANVTGVDSLEETINMVLAGRVDATLNAEVSFDDYMRVHPETALKIAAKAEKANDVVIPFKKGDNTKTLREAVNQAIKELKEDGTLKALSEKYFGKDYTE